MNGLLLRLDALEVLGTPGECSASGCTESTIHTLTEDCLVAGAFVCGQLFS